jgi:2-(1,2-epoxy-1,2-dihydrophenyl)acetyl-CoA isomerase
MSYDHIIVETADDVTTITLNRPERLNACPPAMAVEIGAREIAWDET